MAHGGHVIHDNTEYYLANDISQRKTFDGKATTSGDTVKKWIWPRIALKGMTGMHIRTEPPNTLGV